MLHFSLHTEKLGNTNKKKVEKEKFLEKYGKLRIDFQYTVEPH